ncbi:MAG: class 1 isoprenoid biosynthesis enzyme [Chitinophaga sp.]|uniref:class 1 isoprenoid biosynthesis enzyme n=1 Tax=Chitinophaga sp. TaxID=1869181 RepID=UPI0025B8A94C|nr:class 1 isoprenoid biosynthesis enzyme [Chitinophaga sp.]MBV8251412.1 class 1 isoprenoid biosynthesis enzyme [Chitinophaga sp.]
MYLLRFGAGIVQRVVQIMVRRRKEMRWAATCLAELESNAGAVLPEGARKKVLTSYSIYLPMVIDAFAAVRGRSTSEGERTRMLQYFICSTTFDNFTDEGELTEGELNDIAYASEQFLPRTPQERMFLQSHIALKDFVEDKLHYEEITRSLYQAQVNSNRQTDPDLTDEELYSITIGKGAFAVLLCNFYMDDLGISNNWQRCWYLLGGIIQLTNDLFDTFKDLQAGIQTLPTRMKDADQLYQTFLKMVDELAGEISALPVPEERKQKFLLNMMAICSFGDMALHQFRSIQQTYGVMPDLRTLPRKALIIDMEKAGNIWHCMRFTYRRCRQASH